MDRLVRESSFLMWSLIHSSSRRFLHIVKKKVNKTTGKHLFTYHLLHITLLSLTFCFEQNTAYVLTYTHKYSHVMWYTIDPLIFSFFLWNDWNKWTTRWRLYVLFANHTIYRSTYCALPFSRSEWKKRKDP